jgi:DNA-binding SARP family transcriptional activator
VLSSIGGTYTFTPPPEMWIDLEHAYRRLDRAEGALRHGDHTGAAGDATVASAILRRPLLAGESCLWLDRARRHQADALYRSFITLASAWNQIGDHQLAAATAESAVALDPYRELGHRLLIEAERARGDSGAALRALERCEQVLTEQLGVRPSPETLRLAALVRTKPDE